MSDLENRYRKALRWYPKHWRTDNEDAAVGTLLDQADDEQRAAPFRGELANLRNSGLAARFGFVSAALPSAVRQRAATLTFALGVSISTAGIFFGGWSRDYADRGYHDVWSIAALLQSIGAGQGIYLLWCAAFITALCRLRRTTKILLVVSIPISILWPSVALAFSDYGHPGSVALGFLDLLAAVSVLSDAMLAGRTRSRLAIWTGVFAALLAGAYWLRGYGGGYWGNGANKVDYFWAPFAVWLVFAGIPLALVLAITLWRARRSPWAGGVLMAAAPVLYLWLFAFGWVGGIPKVTAIVLVILVGAAFIIGILRLFGFRVTVTRA